MRERESCGTDAEEMYMKYETNVFEDNGIHDDDDSDYTLDSDDSDSDGSDTVSDEESDESEESNALVESDESETDDTGENE